MGDNHTTLNFCLFNTAEEQTYVVTSFALVKDLAEHFNAGYNRFLVFAKAENLNFVANLYLTGFDTTGCNGTTTCDREDVFDRHEERFLDVANRLLNPVVYCVHEFHYLVFPFFYAVECTECRTAYYRSIFFVVVLCEELAHFHFNEFEHFLVFYHVAFVEEYNKAGYVYLASQKDVLTCLGHRTVGCSYYDNCTVHLGSTGNHVLYIVGVSRAVNVCVVTLCGFVFYVRGVNGNTALFFFGCVVDLVERFYFCVARKSFFCQYFGDGSCKRCLSVVNVTYGTDVNMRFGTLKMFFSHSFYFFIIVLMRFCCVFVEWSCYRDLNSGPLPYQGSALPLSYNSI